MVLLDERDFDKMDPYYITRAICIILGCPSCGPEFKQNCLLVKSSHEKAYSVDTRIKAVSWTEIKMPIYGSFQSHAASYDLWNVRSRFNL